MAVALPGGDWKANCQALTGKELRQTTTENVAATSESCLRKSTGPRAPCVEIGARNIETTDGEVWTGGAMFLLLDSDPVSSSALARPWQRKRQCNMKWTMAAALSGSALRFSACRKDSRFQWTVSCQMLAAAASQQLSETAAVWLQAEAIDTGTVSGGSCLCLSDAQGCRDETCGHAPSRLERSSRKY